MALTESQTNPEKKSSDHKPPDKKEKPLTKVIVRRLPPNIDQETFLNQVSPLPDYNYIYTVKGDNSLGENAFGRVYINFVCPEEVYSFKERFDNYVFLDQRGHEYPAVVEFASFQKIPKKRNKNRVDPKCGTIEADPVYQEFVENINKPQEQDEKPEYSLQLNNDTKTENVDTTPLLEYIKNRKAQRLRTREVRREERKRKELERLERKKVNISKLCTYLCKAIVFIFRRLKIDVNLMKNLLLRLLKHRRTRVKQQIRKKMIMMKNRLKNKNTSRKNQKNRMKNLTTNSRIENMKIRNVT